MREIKFRVWEPYWKKMFYSDHSEYGRCGDGFEYSPAVIRLSNGMKPPDDIPCDMLPLQWTGLIDKNGKEIYEGDLILTDSGFIFKVEWKEALACYDLGIATNKIAISAKKFVEFDFVEPLYWRVQTRVIGNIYENPELIPKG